MRISTRIRNVLVGVVSATALTAGALAVTVTSAWFTRQWQTTKMAGVAKTKARACIEVRDRHGMSAPICTPFFGH